MRPRPDDILGARFEALGRVRRPGGPLLYVQVKTTIQAGRYLSLIVERFPCPRFSQALTGLASAAVWIGRN